MSGWKDLIQFIKTGEPVLPGTPNRVTRDLDGNIRFLRDLLEAAEIGEAVFARDVTVEAGASVGMPVYWDVPSNSFKRGLAQVDVDQASGAIETATTAQIWGVVYEKTNTTLGCIQLFGFTDLDLSLAVDGDVEAGVYYLSAVTPGKLVKQKPAVSVAVLVADGQGGVFVNTTIANFVNDHVHFKYNLVAAPAGDTSPPTVGDPHTITSPDSTLEGWLPADDAIFGGKAPAGAVFGYNLSANSQLVNQWPPVPYNSAVLEWDRGETKELGYIGVADNLVVLDQNGIWWMSDCYGDVPWPTDLDTNSSLSVSASDDCPRELEFKLRLWFTKLSFLTDGSVVTSLATDDDRIQILCENDPSQTARTGPLLLRLALEFMIDQTDVRGGLAFKEFDETTNKFNLGPICEGIFALSSNLTLTGESSQVLNVGGTDRTVHQGLVGIAVDTQGDQEQPVQLIRLDGATEEFYEDVPYIGFPDDELTRIRSQINIPATLALVSPKLKVRLRILGRAAGSLPALTLTGRRLPRDASSATPLPTVDSPITIDTTGAVAADEYIEAESDPIDVAAGDVFLFTVERSDADGYTGELGIIQQTGVITTGT